MSPNTADDKKDMQSFQDSDSDIDGKAFDIEIEEVFDKVKLNEYLKVDRARIYDMLHMFDYYGFSKKSGLLKTEYNSKFPKGQYNLGGDKVRDIFLGPSTLGTR